MLHLWSGFGADSKWTLLKSGGTGQQTSPFTSTSVLLICLNDLPKNCQMTVTYWLIHHAVKLQHPSSETLCHTKCGAWKGCCVALFLFLWTLRFCCRVMEPVAVYLGVRFGTGRGEALRLYDCFIMVIYMAIYLYILCYVCHYMYTSECLFVCVHVLVCVWLSKEGSVFGPPCELGWVTAWASRLLQCTHSHRRTHTLKHIQNSNTHVSELIFQHVFYSINVSWPNTYHAPKQTCCIKME